MRSPNKRSRSKPNRPKSLGNIVNRVFDSSGPEGKVRGTPQQIIEKYQVLARDAQLSNDRVAAENFQQHAEHYTRLLAQAQREQQAEQETRRQQQEDRNRHQQDERGPHNQNNQHNPRRHDQRRNDDDVAQGDTANAGRGAAETAPREADMRETGSRETGYRDAGSRREGDNAFAVQDTESVSETSLVETPESRSDAPATEEKRPSKPANRRKPRAPKPEGAAPEGAPAEAGSDAPAKPRRAPRKPRKPASETEPSASAAE